MKKIAYFIIISLCLTSCEKYKKQPEPVYCFPDEPDLYAYAYFKPGSYWVYQDSISGIIDSVYLTYANNGTYTNGDEEVKKGYYRGTFNWFKCYAKSSYDHYEYMNWMDQSYQVNGGTPRVFRERLKSSGSGYEIGTSIYLGFIDIGKSYYYYDVITYENYYNSYNNSIDTFYFTQKWFHKKSTIDDHQDTYYYIAKNIGIVRKEQLDSNRTWNLVRYNIVQ